MGKNCTTCQLANEACEYGNAYKDSLKQVTEYSPSYKLYFTKQEILDENEYNELHTFMRNLFYPINSKLNLDQLRKIKEIVLSKQN